MYKKVSVVLGALALMVAIGFSSSPSSASGHRTTICHKYASGSGGKERTITVADSAVADHVADHGDTVGACTS
jgi:hypothetical protein